MEKISIERILSYDELHSIQIKLMEIQQNSYTDNINKNRILRINF